MAIQRGFSSSIEENPLVADWLSVIDWAARMNAHSEWFKYLGKYRAAPPDKPYCIPQRMDVDSVSDPLVLACDIGANNLKFALFAYQKGDAHPGVLLAAGSVKTRLAGEQYAHPAEFAQHVADAAQVAFLALVPDWRCRVVAIGLTWPGAVAGRHGFEYVAANSAALAYFAPFPEQKPWEADAELIRTFGLREAFEQHFQVGGRFPYVRLINDAVGHVLFETWQLDASPPRPGEIVVGLTAGTGSGMAVLVAGSGPLFDVLAEVGRLITHISDPFPKPGNPPAGQGRDAFHSATLEKVAARLLTQELVASPVAPRFLAANPRIASHVLALALGNPPSGPVPAVLPRVPSLLISWLIAEQDSPDSAATSVQFKSLWVRDRPSAVAETLLEMREKLRSFLPQIGRWPDERAFAAAVVQHAASELADLVATVADIFGATNVITGGGPLSGLIGNQLRVGARQELERSYQIVDSAVLHHRLARRIWLPEPYGASQIPQVPESHSGAYGAAVAAIEMLEHAAEAS